MMRAWRGSGAVAHGPPGSSARVGDESDSGLKRAKGVGPGQGVKTGRRPLLGPPARLSRAFLRRLRPRLCTIRAILVARARARKNPAALGGG